MRRTRSSAEVRSVLPIAAGAAVLSCAAGPLVAWLGIVRPFSGFILFGLGALLGLMVAIAGIAKAIRGKRRHGLLSALVGLIPVVLAVVPMVHGASAPPINDITTDPGNPPQFVAAVTAGENTGKDLTWPTLFREVQAGAWPELGPLEIAQPPATVYATALQLVKARGWTVTRQQNAGDDHAIEAESRTALFRFVDDVVIRMTPTESGGTRIDMRSRSRVGKGDMGANAARILVFLPDLRAALEAAAPANLEPADE